MRHYKIIYYTSDGQEVLRDKSENSLRDTYLSCLVEIKQIESQLKDDATIIGYEICPIKK